jgi:kynurenine 3-monooxygenase
MMIALPNADGSFTCTLFWPFEGPNSFAAIRTEPDLRRFFTEQFPDAWPLMPTVAEDFFAHPTGSMVTVRCSPWHVGDKVALLGDAAHAVVPFYGQGMNATFEDVLVFNECLERFQPDWQRVFETYETARKPNTDALANLAIGNFLEMRDHTGSRAFLMKKKGEKLLARLLPRWYRPLYVMVTFTRTPYAEAVRRACRQNQAVLAVAGGLIALLTLAAVRVMIH